MEGGGSEAYTKKLFYISALVLNFWGSCTRDISGTSLGIITFEIGTGRCRCIVIVGGGGGGGGMMPSLALGVG